MYGSPSTTDHGNVTANCAASTSDSMPGMASEASVYTAAEPYNSFDTKLGWFADQGVSAVNCSFYWYDSDSYINSEDVTIGQFIYDHYLPVVTISGNYRTTDYETYDVATPGRGFNTITVGAINDKDTGSDLTDDDIWTNSCYEDPTSKNGDLYKPEVSAVGENIDTAGGYSGWYGTSFAAPHVSGLVTLLSKFAGTGDPTPNGYPEYAKAVTLAAAGHDASTFDKEGVGTIQAPDAESIVKNGQYVTDTFAQSNSIQSYDASLDSADSEVRVALAWLTNPQTNNLVDNASAHPDVDLTSTSTTPTAPASITRPPTTPGGNTSASTPPTPAPTPSRFRRQTGRTATTAPERWRWRGTADSRAQSQSRRVA
ncbi:S8 family serine peptidase [Halorussus caseinilyticus]|uniref:S8 family serine peptidase n=1 Tax=Halorussus caseinilyticus TaxID=3034025 RepID=A0ABD5WNF9_9EURY